MFKGHVAIGLILGTGAALTIQTGWIPSHVRIINDVDGSEIEWFHSMGNGAGFKQVAAGTRTRIAAGGAGISEYAGSPGQNSAGFTIGADAQLNVSGQNIRYIAVSTDA